MAVVNKIICDSCNDVADFAIVGNIHVVDTQDAEGVGDGLVGNNLRPGSAASETFKGAEIANVTHLCKACLSSSLGVVKLG